MTKKFRLGVAAIMCFPVSLQIMNAKGEVDTHEFTVTGTRYGIQERQQLFSKMTTVEFMKQAFTGWDGQKLVLNDDGTPAEFSTEALEAMFDIDGVALVIFNDYVKASAAKEKN